MARIFAALGDGTRQTILLLFGHGGAAVHQNHLPIFCPASRTAVVHHLKVLEDAGLISPEKRGRGVSITVMELETALDAWAGREPMCA